MFSLTDISALLSLSPIFGLAAAAPLCAKTIDIAGGGVPDLRVPAAISAGAAKELQLAYFLENLEVSLFSAGLPNITAQEASRLPNRTLEVIGKIAAQEQVHLSSLGSLLDRYNTPRTPPCDYAFQAGTASEFLELGHVVTAIGIGAVIGINQRLAVTDPLLVGPLSSVVPVESRHDAFLQAVRGAAPNPAPFETGISNLWAFNLALSFVRPGSCSVEPPIPILPRLTVSPAPAQQPANGTRDDQREFAWDPTQTPFAAEAGKQLLVGWVNQLSKPVYSALTITGKGRGIAYVPQGLRGVVFAAVTVQLPDNIHDLSSATLAGPVIVPLP